MGETTQAGFSERNSRHLDTPGAENLALFLIEVSFFWPTGSLARFPWGKVSMETANRVRSRK